MRRTNISFGIQTIGLSLALLSCLVACKKESADLPPQTNFDDKGMPQSDQSFTPAEIHRDQPIGLDTTGLSPKPTESSAVAPKPPVQDLKPVAASVDPAAPPVAIPEVKVAAEVKAAKPAEPVVAKPVVGAGEVVPSASGDWVIQVNVHRSQTQAQAQVVKLAQDGIPAYTVNLQTGEETLSGSYWRVRVGYFSSRANAQKYGTAVLEPKGLKIWIDKKSNEAKQGNP